ncbi:HAD family hydrolase [Streptomyces albus]|nr:HAD family hydrolase [Streptomyces albus]MDI6410107.1 HAD family hydrolase [Streptomyces albus]
MGAAKPDPAVFHAACAAYRLRPAQVVYVGDRLSTDAEAATAAGLRGVWLDRDGTAPPGEPTVPRIERLDELPALIP